MINYSYPTNFCHGYHSTICRWTCKLLSSSEFCSKPRLMYLLSVISETQREKWMLKMFIKSVQKYAQYSVYLREKIPSQKHIDFFLCLR